MDPRTAAFDRFRSAISATTPASASLPERTPCASCRPRTRRQALRARHDPPRYGPLRPERPFGPLPRPMGRRGGGQIPRPERVRRPLGSLRPLQPDRHGPPSLQTWRRHSGRDGRKRPAANEDELYELAGQTGPQLRGDDPQARGLARRHGRPRGGVDPRRPSAASAGTVVPAPIEKTRRKVEPETVSGNMNRN